MNNPFIQPITILGDTLGRGPGKRFGIYQADRLFHTYVIGQTGTGKSTLLLNMLRQDAGHGRGFCLIDPHGDLAEASKESIGNNSIYWDVADPECLFGYNPLTFIDAKFRPLVASGIIETLKQQWSDAWGVRMEHLLRFALLALLDNPGSTLRDIVPMFTNKTFRMKVLEQVTDEEVLRFWNHEFPSMNYKNAFDGVAPIANKLGAFLANPLIRNALCSPENPIRFRKLMDEGTPLIVNLSKGRLGSDVTNVLGGLIVSSMAHAAYTRVDTPEPRRRPYFLFADEFHSFTTDAFAGMLSELRKYRLGLVLAHQHTSQVSKTVLESILGNVGTQIILRVGANDAPLLSRQLSLKDTADLINQPNYSMLIRLMIKGEVSSYFSAKTLFASCSSGSILTKCHKSSQSQITMNEFETLYQQAGFSSVSEAAEFLGYSEKSIYRYKSGEETPRVATIRALQGLVLVRDNSPAQTSFTFIDLFAGIGGLRKAFEAHGGRCVFTSEWDRFAQQTYHANFLDNRPIEGDITKIYAKDIPEHNVLVAGFPCQPFSIAGVSKKNALGRLHGFDDETQGTLFFDVLRILKHHRPEAFLLENVKNLRSHDKGRTFEVIRRKLEDELGYELHIQVIDAQHFVPQHRERIALVGFREGTKFSWSDLNLPEKSARKIGSILHPEDGFENVESHFTEGKRAKVSSKYTLSDKLWKYLVDYAAKHKAKGNGFGYGMVDKTSIARTLSARYYKDGSEILVSRGKGKNPRRLTPRECARLMGYDDDFRIPVSDTQAYKQFGNSVAVPVFREVARIMTPHVIKLLESDHQQELRKFG